MHINIAMVRIKDSSVIGKAATNSNRQQWLSHPCHAGLMSDDVDATVRVFHSMPLWPSDGLGGAAAWQASGNIPTNYKLFIRELQDVFDHPDRGQSGTQRLLCLRQGSASVAELTFASWPRIADGMNQPSWPGSARDSTQMFNSNWHADTRTWLSVRAFLWLSS